jgi:hypothetical protein
LLFEVASLLMLGVLLHLLGHARCFLLLAWLKLADAQWLLLVLHAAELLVHLVHELELLGLLLGLLLGKHHLLVLLLLLVHLLLLTGLLVVGDGA